MGQVDNKSQAMALIVQQKPALVLLDSGLTLQKMLPVLMQVKGGYPRSSASFSLKTHSNRLLQKKQGATPDGF